MPFSRLTIKNFKFDRLKNLLSPDAKPDLVLKLNTSSFSFSLSIGRFVFLYDSDVRTGFFSLAKLEPGTSSKKLTTSS